MPRRTVTIPTGLDKAIRSLQARLMRDENRDITYTEALNAVLVAGFFRLTPDRKTIAYWKEGDKEASGKDLAELLEGYDPEKLRFEGFLDMLPTGSEPNE